MHTRILFITLSILAYTNLLPQCLEDNVFLRIDFNIKDNAYSDSIEVCIDQLIADFKSIYPNVEKFIAIDYYAGQNLTELGGNVKNIQECLNSKGIELPSYKFRFIFHSEKEVDSDFVRMYICLKESP